MTSSELLLLRQGIQIELLSQKYQINRKRILEIIDRIFKTLKLKQAALTVQLVSNQKMIALNKETFHLNASTDVISFPWKQFKKKIPRDQYLGDVVLCLDRIRRQAKEFDHSFAQEFIYCLIHGLLHLLGFEDTTKQKQKEMFQLQDQLYHKVSRGGLITSSLVKVKGQKKR